MKMATLPIDSRNNNTNNNNSKQPPPLSPPLCTRTSIASDLTNLGILPGDTLLVHSSLRRLGWVCGGAQSVIEAILDVLGPTGTLVMPTHTGDNSDPSRWISPPAPEDWWQPIRDNMPAFEADVTATRAMGVIPELFRRWPGALRSGHPQTSFAALGPDARHITEGHALDCLLGEQSPLARLEENEKAKVLLLGVGFDVCTSFHLAEYRFATSTASAAAAVLPKQLRCNNSFAVMVDGQRQWLTVDDIILRDDDFVDIGRAWEEHKDCISIGRVGAAESRLFSMPAAVAHALDWMKRNRART